MCVQVYVSVHVCLCISLSGPCSCCSQGQSSLEAFRLVNILSHTTRVHPSMKQSTRLNATPPTPPPCPCTFAWLTRTWHLPLLLKSHHALQLSTYTSPVHMPC